MTREGSSGFPWLGELSRRWWRWGKSELCEVRSWTSKYRRYIYSFPLWVVSRRRTGVKGRNSWYSEGQYLVFWSIIWTLPIRYNDVLTQGSPTSPLGSNAWGSDAIIEIKCTISVMCVNHSLSHPWKNRLPGNQFLVARTGTTILKDTVFQLLNYTKALR